MEHQDWKEVILRKPSAQVTKGPTFTPPKEKDVHDHGVEPKITPELREKLKTARGPMPQKELCNKAGQMGCKLVVKDVQRAEAGQCTLKEGKQIALAYQKVLKVKIL
jgi:hypothetical protein